MRSPFTSVTALAFLASSGLFAGLRTHALPISSGSTNSTTSATANANLTTWPLDTIDPDILQHLSIKPFGELIYKAVSGNTQAGYINATDAASIERLDIKPFGMLIYKDMNSSSAATDTSVAGGDLVAEITPGINRDATAVPGAPNQVTITPFAMLAFNDDDGVQTVNRISAKYSTVVDPHVSGAALTTTVAASAVTNLTVGADPNNPGILSIKPFAMFVYKHNNASEVVENMNALDIMSMGALNIKPFGELI